MKLSIAPSRCFFLYDDKLRLYSLLNMRFDLEGIADVVKVNDVSMDLHFLSRKISYVNMTNTGVRFSVAYS